MKNNLFFKILASLPIILITLYFIPFLGICLILLRYFMYNSKKRFSTPIIIAAVGFIILIPKVLYFVLKKINFDINSIPYLNDIVNADLYNIDFMKYSKFLICVGVILLIISFILKSVFDKLNNGIQNYISETEKRDAEISKKNDMEIKIKQEKAKNTNYVKCPNCGSDNLLSDKFGTCKYCRRKIENKGYER